MNSKRSTLKYLALLVVASLCSATTPGTAEAQPVSIYVGPVTRDGFVDMDNGVQDSIRDIQKELRKSPIFSVVGTPAEARIVLAIVGRRVSGSGGAVGVTTSGTTIGGGTIAGVQQPTLTTPGTTVMVPMDRRAVESVLRVGTYEKSLVSEGADGAGWGLAAKAVVKDVTAWVAANRAALLQRP